MEEDYDDDYFSHLRMGCYDCGSIFDATDLYEGRCPICDSNNVATFEEALEVAREHKRFMQDMGLAEEE